MLRKKRRNSFAKISWMFLIGDLKTLFNKGFSIIFSRQAPKQNRKKQPALEPSG